MRAPLLDQELAEFCSMMPSRLKIRRGVTKYALRQAAIPWLPNDIIGRAKQGFMFPVAYWLDGAMLRRILDCLLRSPLVSEGWIEREGIERLLSEHKQRQVDHHVRIWMLLNLDVWFRMYVEGESSEWLSEAFLAKNEMPFESPGGYEGHNIEAGF
jgi:asparagine synthase (glutamine-hydrolysing)